MFAAGVSLQAIHEQLGAKQLTYEAVTKAGKQLVSQKNADDDEALQKKIDDLEQKWNEVCKLSADRQQKLDRIYGELGNKKPYCMLIVMHFDI